jgi:hypothetical protein
LDKSDFIRRFLENPTEALQCASEPPRRIACRVQIRKNVWMLAEPLFERKYLDASVIPRYDNVVALDHSVPSLIGLLIDATRIAALRSLVRMLIIRYINRSCGLGLRQVSRVRSRTPWLRMTGWAKLRFRHRSKSEGGGVPTVADHKPAVGTSPAAFAI